VGSSKLLTLPYLAGGVLSRSGSVSSFLANGGHGRGMLADQVMAGACRWTRSWQGHDGGPSSEPMPPQVPPSRSWPRDVDVF